MKENRAGNVFRNHMEKGLFNRLSIELNHEVDIHALELSYRMTLIACPFFERTLIADGDRLFFKKHHNRCKVGSIPSMTDGFPHTGEPCFGRDLVEVYASGNRIVTGISHALTDGLGKSIFNKLLLYHYFCLTDRHEYVNPFANMAVRTIDHDMDLDVFLDKLYPQIDIMPDCLRTEPCFHLPEKKAAAATEYLIETDQDAFRSLTRSLTRDIAIEASKLLPIGGRKCLVLFYLMALSVAKLNPMCDLPISCRFPVNARSILGAEGALRNLSHGQAVVAVTPKTLAGDSHDVLAKVTDRFPEQLTEEALGWQYSRMSELITDQKNTPQMSLLFDRTMLISNVGQEYYEPEQKNYVRSAKNLYDHNMFAIYLYSQKDKQIISINQPFSSDRYARELVAVLNRHGLAVTLTKSENDGFHQEGTGKKP